MMIHTQKAFTLVELLVVVLIIGILAAIAIPAYENAVAKTRLTQTLTAVKSIADAENRYYMETNEFTTDPTNLDIVFPMNASQTQFQLPYGYCHFTYINDLNPRAACQLDSPHVMLLQYLQKNRLNCYSYSDDNFKGDFVCQELTTEEQPYYTSSGMHYFSAGIKPGDEAAE